MSFPFKKIVPRVFSKTFLKDVAVEALFTPSVAYEDEVFQQEVKEFLASKFPGVVTEEWRFTEDGCTITYETHKYGFRPGVVWAKLRFPAYSSFVDMENVLPVPLRYMAISGATEIEALRLIKFNELSFEIEEGHRTTMVEVMSELFSRDLLTYMGDWDDIASQLKEDKDITRWERTLNLDDDGVAARVIYGFHLDPDNTSKGSLILKIIIQSSGGKSGYEEEKFKRELKDLNEWCDAAFEWAVTPEILKEMQKS